MTIYEINQTKVDGGELFQSAHLLEKKMWKVGVNSSTNKVLNYKATPVMISGVIDWSSFRCRRAAAVTPEFITNDGILRHAKTKTRLQFSPGDDHRPKNNVDLIFCAGDHSHKPISILKPDKAIDERAGFSWGNNRRLSGRVQ